MESPCMEISDLSKYCLTYQDVYNSVLIMYKYYHYIDSPTDQYKAPCQIGQR